MSRKNPVINQVKVQHKSFRIFEQFRDWLYDKSSWTIGEIDTGHSGANMFSITNTRELRMLVPDCGEDQLVLRLNEWGTPNYSVTYYEQLTDTDGEEYFEATQTETFPIDQLHIAIECFMTRWASDKPFNATNLRPNTKGVLVDLINTTMTSESMQHRLTDWSKVRNSPYANISKETLLSSKHFDVSHTEKVLDKLTPELGMALDIATSTERDNTLLAVKCKADNLPDVSDLKLVYENGVIVNESAGSVPKSSLVRELAKSIGVAVVEPSLRPQYTGDKNNHGTGSLDHIDW